MAYYCLLELHRFPSEWMELPREERAFVAACILLKMENEKKQQQKLKSGRGRKR